MARFSARGQCVNQSLRARILLNGYPFTSDGTRERVRRNLFGRTAGGRMPQVLFVSVVDDDRFNRASMRRLVTSLGYTVEDFASAADFLASPRLAETACLIADVHMPTMTGVELYRHLTAVRHAIPTILVTGRPDDSERSRALSDGVVCYLGKPVTEERLVQCLHLALQCDDPQ